MGQGASGTELNSLPSLSKSTLVVIADHTTGKYYQCTIDQLLALLSLTGGNVGEVLKKTGAGDYQYEWAPDAGGPEIDDTNISFTKVWSSAKAFAEDELIWNALLQKESDLQDAIGLLQSELNNEITDRVTTDTNLLALINSEQTDRVNADNGLQDQITAEATARENADNAVISQIVSTASTDYNNLAKIQAKLEALNTLLTSNDVNLDTLQEIVDFIKDNEADITSLLSGKVNISDVYNALDYTLAGKVLDARQGKALKDLIDAKESSSNKATTITGNETSNTLFATIKAITDYLKQGLTSLFTTKSTPVDADNIVIEDSEDANKSKKISWLNIKRATNTYLGTTDSNVLTQRMAKITGTASGTNTYVLTIDPAPALWTDINVVMVKFTNANTGACTLNINKAGGGTLGAKTMLRPDGLPLVAGDITAGAQLPCLYDGTNIQVIGIKDNAEIPTLVSALRFDRNYTVRDTFSITGALSLTIDTTNFRPGMIHRFRVQANGVNIPTLGTNITTYWNDYQNTNGFIMEYTCKSYRTVGGTNKVSVDIRKLE